MHRSFFHQLAFVAALMISIAGSVLYAGSSEQPKDEGFGEHQAFDELWVSLQLDDLIDIMREEGIDLAVSSDQQLLGRAGGPEWRKRVDKIYDVPVLRKGVSDAMLAALEPAEIAALLEYYQQSDIQKIVALEISARRAFLESEVEQRARSMWMSGQAVTPHEDEIFRFVKINDLIERNVAGALNSHYAFLRALSDAHPVVSERMTDQEILSEVWAEEFDIRRDTSEWLYAFLATAYDPLTQDALRAYVDFSATGPGRALNRAIFDAFDDMYLTLSAQLGAAVGQVSAQHDL